MDIRIRPQLAKLTASFTSTVTTIFPRTTVSVSYIFGYASNQFRRPELAIWNSYFRSERAPFAPNNREQFIVNYVLQHFSHSVYKTHMSCRWPIWRFGFCRFHNARNTTSNMHTLNNSANMSGLDFMASS